MHTIVHEKSEPLLSAELPQSYIDRRANESDLLLRLVRANPLLKNRVQQWAKERKSAEEIIKIVDIIGELPQAFEKMFLICEHEFVSHLNRDHPVIRETERLTKIKLDQKNRERKQARMLAHRQRLYGAPRQ